MPIRVSNILEQLEKIAPKALAFSFDKVGLQVGNPNAEVSKALVSLDRSVLAAEEAVRVGAELMLTHHPLIFQPIDRVLSTDHVGKTVSLLLKHGISHVAAHTNWDSAVGGINDVLAELLGLQNTKPFGSGASVDMLKVAVFCPAEAVSVVREAAANAGAGTIGEYEACAFSSEGIGYFRASDSANPFVGNAGEDNQASEVRLEMVLPKARKEAVRNAIIRSHPYETPAIDFFLLEAETPNPAGRVGELPAAMSLGGFADHVAATLGQVPQVWGKSEDLVRKVAVVGGAADGDWSAARRAGADVFLTGEVRQHIAVEASEMGMAIVAAGHYATENPGTKRLCEKMAELVPEVEWIFFDPAPGLGGRPL